MRRSARLAKHSSALGSIWIPSDDLHKIVTKDVPLSAETARAIYLNPKSSDYCSKIINKCLPVLRQLIHAFQIDYTDDKLAKSTIITWMARFLQNNPRFLAMNAGFADTVNRKMAYFNTEDTLSDERVETEFRAAMRDIHFILNG